VSIRKRGHNYWEICINEGVDPETGKRIRTYHSFRGTERQAHRMHTDLQYARDHGMSVQPSRLTVSEYLEQWLNDYARLHVSPRTLQGYRDMVKLHIGPELGKIKLSKLRPAHLQRYYSNRLDSGRKKPKVRQVTEEDGTTTEEVVKGLSPQTVQHHHRLLYEALSTAVKWGLLHVNPADAVTAPKVRRKEPTVLTEEQTEMLLTAARGSRVYLPVVLAVGSGLRRGELLALRWSDIDLETGKVTVLRTLSETREDGLTFKEPKSATSRRVVTLPAFAVEALKEHKKAQAAHRLQVGPGYKDHDLVMPNEDGSPWAPNLLTGAFGDLIKKLDLPRVRFHDLRHGHITHLLLRGVPLKVASARAGHSGIAITADLYGHLLPGADEEAASRLDSAYGGGSRAATDGSK